MGSDLIIRFIGLDLVSRAAERAGNSVDRLQNRVNRAGLMSAQSWVAAGIAATTFGITMTAAAGAAAAGALSLVETAAKFDSYMVMTVTHAGLARDSVKGVTADLLRMAPAVGFGPQALAEAFYHVQSASTSLVPSLRTISGEESILREAARLAQIGHADLTDTVNTLISVLGSYGKTGMDAASAAAQLNSIVGNGNVTMQQFATAMQGGLLPVAADAGVKLSSLGAAFGTLTDLGFSSARSATYLRSAIIQMTTPTGPAVKALKAIGLAGDDVAKQMGFFNEVLNKAGVNQTEVAHKLQETGSLSQTLDMLEAKMRQHGLSATESAGIIEKAFGGIRSGAGILGLTNNLDSLRIKEGLIQKSTQEWQSTWQYFESTDPNFVILQLRAGMETLAITIGNALMPTFLQIAHVIGPLIQQFTEWVKAHSDLVAKVVIVGIAIAGILGVLMTLGGIIAIVGGSLGVLFGVVGSVVAGLGAFAGAFAVFASAEGVVAALGVALGGLLPVIAAVGAAFVIFTALTPLFQEVTATVRVFEDTFKRTHNATRSLEIALRAMGVTANNAAQIAYGLQGAFNDIRKIFELLGPPIRKAFDDIKKSIPQEDLNQLIKAASELGAAFTQYVLPVLGVLVLVLGSILGGVFQGLVAFLVAVIPAAIKVTAGAFQILAGIINLIGAIFAGAIAIIDDVIHGRWEKVSTDFTNMTMHMGEAVGQIFNGLKDVVIGATVGMAMAVWALVSGFVMGVIGAFQNLYNVLVGHSIIPDLINGIIYWFAGLPGRIFGIVDGWTGGLIGRINSMAWQGLQAAIGVGENVVRGIESGLSNAWGGLMSTFHRLASQLPQPVKDALGITSPSKVFAQQIGLPIAQGVALGVASGTDLVHDSISSLTGIGGSIPVFGATAAMSVGASVGGSAAQSGRPDAASILASIHDVLVDIRDADKKSGGASTAQAPATNASRQTSMDQLGQLLYELTNKTSMRRNQYGMRAEYGH